MTNPRQAAGNAAQGIQPIFRSIHFLRHEGAGLDEGIMAAFTQEP
jgi:hypothetical protein